jgi:serine/threonine-protein kinase RsbW
MPVLQTTSDLNNLAAMRDFVCSIASSNGAGEELLGQVIAAVDEAATNIIVHGYKKRPGLMIEVEVNIKSGALVVCLRDHAPEYDPTSLPPPDTTLPLEKRRIGGMGVYLMKQYMDQVLYHPLAGGGNELTMVRKL